MDDCNTTHVRGETNKSRVEELPRYIQKSNIKEEQSSHVNLIFDIHIILINCLLQNNDNEKMSSLIGRGFYLI